MKSSQDTWLLYNPKGDKLIVARLFSSDGTDDFGDFKLLGWQRTKHYLIAQVEDSLFFDINKAREAGRQKREAGIRKHNPKHLKIIKRKAKSAIEKIFQNPDHPYFKGEPDHVNFVSELFVFIYDT